MNRGTDSEPLLTLEPLLEAVREGLQGAGWRLSGLQKTTSYEFEGRWAGESTRSAYLVYHRDGLPDWVSMDVFLDETSRGLKGNLALVVEGPPLAGARDPGRVLSGLVKVASPFLPAGHQAPLTLRYNLESLRADPERARTECRFKLQLSRDALAAGSASITALAWSTARAFEQILASEDILPFLEGEDPHSSGGQEKDAEGPTGEEEGRSPPREER